MSVHGVQSDPLLLTHGVPQGSVLGPILFLIYVNDLADCVPGVRFTLFADDTTVSVSDPSFDSLCDRLCEAQLTVEDWFTCNQLSLNSSKSVNIMFTLRRLHMRYNSVKFLGVMLDSKLNWNSHVDYMSDKLVSSIYLLRSIGTLVSPRVRIMAYHALVASLLGYAVLCWGHAPAAQRLFKLQRRAIRVVAGIGYREDCRDAFKRLKILTLPSLFILECLKYTKQNETKFFSHSGVHSHGTRSRDNLVVPFHRVFASRSGTNYFGPLLFNALPMEIKQLPFNKYIGKIKDHLHNRAYYSVQECICDGFRDMVI